MTAIANTTKTDRRAEPGKVYRGFEICENDECRTLSELYAGLPQCTECDCYFCHGCMAECGEPDEGHSGRGICKNCKAQENPAHA